MWTSSLCSPHMYAWLCHRYTFFAALSFVREMAVRLLGHYCWLHHALQGCIVQGWAGHMAICRAATFRQAVRGISCKAHSFWILDSGRGANLDCRAQRKDILPSCSEGQPYTLISDEHKRMTGKGL